MKDEWQYFNPKVSIIIPVYNGSNYLKEAIDSALTQTYKNIEILVINDGSKDNGATEKIAKSYGNKIKYYHKANGGVATALNLGIKKMTGEYFSWLSHDDKYKPFKIEKQIALVRSLHDKNVIVASNSLALYESGIKKRERINKSTFKYFDIFLSTSAVVGVNGCSLLIPKHALDRANGFKEDLPVTQDYDLWFRLKDNYKFVLLEKYLVVSRRHSQQDSVQKGKILHEEADLLHYNFLKTIAANRFEEYFLKNKTNINYIFNNYLVYKSQGYRRTATMLLKIILSHYYKYNPKKFYDIFNSQLSANIGLMLNGTKDGTELNFFSGHKSTKTNLDDVLLECEKLFPVLTNSILQNVSVGTVNYRNEYVGRFVDSIKRDGIYLSAEKIVRTVVKSLKK